MQRGMPRNCGLEVGRRDSSTVCCRGETAFRRRFMIPTDGPGGASGPPGPPPSFPPSAIRTANFSAGNFSAGKNFDEKFFGRKKFRPKTFRSKNFRPKHFRPKVFWSKNISDEKKLGARHGGKARVTEIPEGGFAPPDPPTTTFQKICPSRQIF